jgi:hypothetical protein
MPTPQTISDKKLTQIDFSHRFADWEDPDQPNQTETIVWMADRALGVLRLLECFLEHECDVTLHALTSVSAIVAEVEDIKAVARAVMGED